eukprot:288798_1
MYKNIVTTFDCPPSKHVSLKHIASHAPFICCFKSSTSCISMYEQSRSPDFSKLNHGKCICKNSFAACSPMQYVKEPWGSWNNFLLSYGLKPWNSNDQQQGILIATKFMEHDKMQWIEEHKKCKQNSINMTINTDKMCSNCCMKLLISTDGFHVLKQTFCVSQQVGFTMSHFLNHPQIFYHITRQKNIDSLFNLLYILAAFMKDSSGRCSMLQLAFRLYFWFLLLQQCSHSARSYSKKCLLRLVTTHGGEYLDLIINEANYALKMNDAVIKCNDTLKINNPLSLLTIISNICALFITKFREYFMKKIKKYPRKLCYIKLKKFYSILPIMFDPLKQKGATPVTIDILTEQEEYMCHKCWIVSIYFSHSKCTRCSTISYF